MFYIISLYIYRKILYIRYCAESNIGSNELMKVQLNYISENDCKKSYAEDLGTRRLPDGLIQGLLCAGIMEGGKDTCQVRAIKHIELFSSLLSLSRKFRRYYLHFSN